MAEWVKALNGQRIPHTVEVRQRQVFWHCDVCDRTYPPQMAVMYWCSVNGWYRSECLHHLKEREASNGTISH